MSPTEAQISNRDQAIPPTIQIDQRQGTALRQTRAIEPLHFSLREALLIVMAIAMSCGLLRLNPLFAALVLPCWIIGLAQRLVTSRPMAWIYWGKDSPLPLSVFLWFAMLATIFPWTLHFDVGLRAAFTPLVSRPSVTLYGFTIFFAWNALFGAATPRRGSLYSIYGLLLLFIVFGVLEMQRPIGNDFGNPFLTVSPDRWICALGLPTAWLAALTLPNVRRFASKNGAQANVIVPAHVIPKNE